MKLDALIKYFEEIQEDEVSEETLVAAIKSIDVLLTTLLYKANKMNLSVDVSTSINNTGHTVNLNIDVYKRL